MREILHDDNLRALERLDDGSVAMVYMDPPFNTGRRFDQHVAARGADGSDGTRLAFDDAFVADEDCVRLVGEVVPEAARRVGALLSAAPSTVRPYLEMLTPRLAHARRVLRADGSLFVHCDPTANHWIRGLLDCLLGAKQFKNEIVWRRTAAHGSARRFAPVHDTIYFYGRASAPRWTDPHLPYSADYLERYYRHEDGRGRYQLITCSAPGDRTGTRAHYCWKERWPPPGRHWAYVEERMRELETEGRLVYSSKGTVRQKRYTNDGLGVRITDFWDDLPRVDTHARERVGWDTQKPLALLARIIQATTVEGDVVADPFCGTGTTALASWQAGRDFWACDTSLSACALTLGRLRDAGCRDAVQLTGFPRSVAEAMALRARDIAAFGTWGTGVLGTILDRKASTRADAVGQGRRDDRTVISLVPLQTSEPRSALAARADVWLDTAESPAKGPAGALLVPVARCVDRACLRDGGVRQAWA